MLRYLFQFFLTLLILAAMVWYGVPLLKKHFPEKYALIETAVVKDKKAGTAGFEQISAPFSGVFSANSDPARSSVSEAIPGESLTNSAAYAGHESENADTRVGTETTSEPGPSTEAEIIPEPEEDRYVTLKQGSRYKWGVVVTNSAAYDVSMNRIGILPGGTVVEQIDRKLIPSGHISGCVYVLDNEWRNEMVYLYDSDLVIFGTPLSESSKEDRDLIIRYCKLYGELEELRQAARRDAIRSNPYYEAYRKAVKELTDFNEQGQRLAQRHESATGPERARLSDEMRKAKQQEVRLTKVYNDIKVPYENWRNANLGTGKNINVQPTQKMKYIERQMERMRNKVQEIVPGL